MSLGHVESMLHPAFSLVSPYWSRTGWFDETADPSVEVDAIDGVINDSFAHGSTLIIYAQGRENDDVKLG